MAEHPKRASANAVAVPAGPPPNTATSTSRITLRLNVLAAFLNDEPEFVPVGDHILGAADNVANPRHLQTTGFGKDLVWPLGGPPGQFVLLCAICEVRLPGDGHLFRNIARAEVRVIQPKWFDIRVAVAQKPTRFDARKKRAADARLQRSSVEPARRDFIRGLRRGFPIVDELAFGPFFHHCVLDSVQRLVAFFWVVVRPDHGHVRRVARLVRWKSWVS